MSMRRAGIPYGCFELECDRDKPLFRETVRFFVFFFSSWGNQAGLAQAGFDTFLSSARHRSAAAQLRWS